MTRVFIVFSFLLSLLFLGNCVVLASEHSFHFSFLLFYVFFLVLLNLNFKKMKYDHNLPTELRVSRKRKVLLIVTGPTRRYFNIVFIRGYIAVHSMKKCMHHVT